MRLVLYSFFVLRYSFFVSIFTALPSYMNVNALGPGTYSMRKSVIVNPASRTRSSIFLIQVTAAGKRAPERRQTILPFPDAGVGRESVLDKNERAARLQHAPHLTRARRRALAIEHSDQVTTTVSNDASAKRKPIGVQTAAARPETAPPLPSSLAIASSSA